MALSGKIAELLTRSPADVAREQLRKLYLRMYPYIVGDFAHKEDLNIAFTSIKLELQQIKGTLQAHTHVSASPGSLVTPTTSIVSPVVPSVQPTEAIANSLVVPGGVPQPTGGGISLQPSRLDPNPIAIPPINPLDPGV